MAQPEKLILVADDDPAIRAMLVKILSRLGYGTLAAQDGAQALDLLGREGAQVQAVVLDLQMPGSLPTEQIVGELGLLNRDIRVLLCSGAQPDRTLLQSRPLGTIGYLPKPFSIDSLVHSLGQLLPAVP